MNITTIKTLTKAAKRRSIQRIKKGHTHWGAIALILLLTLIAYALIVAEAAAEVPVAPSTHIGLKTPPSPVLALQEAPKPSPVERPIPQDKEALKNLIISEMEKAGYKAPQFAVRVAMCESSLNPNAVGDGGSSYGLWQWHLPAHPSITKEQALDPVWSTRRAAEYFAAGKAHLWTCARLLS